MKGRIWIQVLRLPVHVYSMIYLSLFWKIGHVSLFSWLCYLIFRWSYLGSVCLLGRLLHIWGSEYILTWVGFNILIPHLVLWAWWHVGVLFWRGLTCDLLSWLSRLGLISKFLCRVVLGGSKLLLHGWLRISCRLDGVWGESQVDVRVVVLNRSWWWTRGVGIWISLSSSWLLLGGWNCGLLRWIWIKILVDFLMGQACYCLLSPQLYRRNRSFHLL